MKVITIAGTLGLSGALGCNSGNATDTSASTEAAIRASSPACTSARDACGTQAETIATGIETACKPVETACGGQGGAAGSGATTSCSDARAACKAAIASAEPMLEALGKSCETSIHAACVVDEPDGGVGASHVGGSGGRGGFDHDGGFGGHEGFGGKPMFGGQGGGAAGHDGFGNDDQESAACESAEDACRQSLGSLLSMPPAACLSIGNACAGQTPATATDACKTAITDCHDAITMAAGGAQQVCGTGISDACRGHGG
jgi:hypothetical protein